MPATYIASTLDGREISARMAAMARGAYKLVYVAPERLSAPGFRDLVLALKGANKELAERIYRFLSPEVAKALRDDVAATERLARALAPGGGGLCRPGDGNAQC